MLTGPRAAALGALVALAGCLGPSGDDAEALDAAACLFGGPARDPPQHREAFNVTDEHVERFPVLASLFEDPAHLVEVGCDDGLEILRALEADGADVLFLDQERGHNVYLTYRGLTLRVVLTRAT